MKAIMLEIRDRHTLIPALAVLMRPATLELTRATITDEWPADRQMLQTDHLLRLKGYWGGERFVLLLDLRSEDARGTCNPDNWDHWGMGPRTMPAAHRWIIAHWDELSAGQVVDVEFILGEKPEPSKPTREEEVTWPTSTDNA